MRIMKIKSFVIVLIVFITCAYRFKDDRVFHINGIAQGTTYHVSYWAADSLVSKQEIDKILAQLDSSLSIYKPYSLINKFNNSTNGIKTDEHLRIVVSKSLEIYKETQGKFDITVYPLVNAWGFGNKKITSLPDSAQIKALMPCVGSDKLELLNNTLNKASPCVKIDVNGIAQGYSVDVVAKYLAKKGIKNYLVEIGGELIAAGRKANGEGMKIGIESPSANSGDEPIISRIITIKDVAITTSGNYRKYLESGKQRIVHLIDPKTGYPIHSEMVSATVIAKDAITADGYDNPLMAMTVSEAIVFADRKQIAAYFIYHQADGKLADTATTSFYRLLDIPANPAYKK
jgi:thiamine biosynthesis lipoprotein